jgi:acetyl-CoA synthetase
MVAFVSIVDGIQSDSKLEKELADWVARKIGKFAVPERIIFSADLPKTRSGKIMRRLLRDIADGSAMGNITTLADPTVIDALKAKYEEE